MLQNVLYVLVNQNCQAYLFSATRLISISSASFEKDVYASLPNILCLIFARLDFPASNGPVPALISNQIAGESHVTTPLFVYTSFSQAICSQKRNKFAGTSFSTHIRHFRPGVFSFIYRYTLKALILH